MSNGVENASLSLKSTKLAYLNLLGRLNVAKTNYITSEVKSKGLDNEINYYETEIRKYEDILRKCGVAPEQILRKRMSNASK